MEQAVVAGSIPVPSATTAVKLASLAVHTAELFREGIQCTPAGVYDMRAIDSLLADEQVQAYCAQLNALALLPVPR